MTDYVAHVKITANLWHEELIKRDLFFFFNINYIFLEKLPTNNLLASQNVF